MKRWARTVRIGLVVGAASLFVLGWSADVRWAAGDPTCKEPPPAALTAESDAVRLVLSKDVARPGERITMTFTGPRERITRGLSAALECWDGRQWAPQYVLISGTIPSAMPWAKHPVINSIGYDGIQPERIKLPEEIEPGRYRIRKEISVTGEDQTRTLHAFVEIVN